MINLIMLISDNAKKTAQMGGFFHLNSYCS